jgi:hypothetical protein
LADPIYLTPSKEDPLLQGDIFKRVPFIWVPERPLLVARHFRMGKEGRELYGVHKEFDGRTSNPGSARPPDDPFRWEERENPELVLVPVVLAMGIVLTHDCEIEHDDHRLLAIIRPITDLEEPYRQKCLDGEDTDLFPLLPQDAQPSMPMSFVDFTISTPLRPRGLDQPAERYASTSLWLRMALAGAYWEYLHHKFNEPRPPMKVDAS